MNPITDNQLMVNRRQFFGRSAVGIGSAALGSLLAREGLGAASPGGLGMLPHFAPKAKRVVYLFMNGAPTHTDLFDYKPLQKTMHGQPVPQEFVAGKRFSTMTGNPKGKLMLAPIEPFKQHGQSGAWVSNFLPHIAKAADDICFIKSMHTTQVNHSPAVSFFLSGGEMPGRPTMGAWLSYGLGSMNENLPNYVVMHARTKHAEQSLFGRLWGSGFMSSQHQGVLLRSQGDPVLYLNNPAGVTRQDRRAQLDTLAALNHAQHKRFADPSVLARIKQHEMAYRMQASVPELMDLSKEPDSTFKLYGDDAKTPGTFAACCLNARRLAERGVRNIQIFHRGWDAHGNLAGEHGNQCKDVDQGSAALIKDLKNRGLLEDTLIVWGGEFGRTPYCQGKLGKDNYGRDHHPRCFSIWMAGGGIKPGITYGRTDDYGYNIADADGNMLKPQPRKDKWTPGTMHIHDLNATILHQLGIDHRKLTYRYQGRDFRLTDVHGHVVKDILV